MANLIIKPTSGGSLILQDEGGTAAHTIDASGNHTLSGATNNIGTVTGGTIDNAPAGVTTKHFGFSAYLSGGMTINNATWTEVTATWTERWDSDGKFNTSTGRFTPTIQGIYHVGYSTSIDEIDDGEYIISVIRKNGAGTDGTNQYAYQILHAPKTDGTMGCSASSLIQLDTDDYVSLWANQNGGGNDPLNQDLTEFWAVYQGQV